MCLAIPGKISSISNSDLLQRTGVVDFDGITKTVSLVCVPDAQLGDYVLVHVGVAISIIDEQHAQEVFEYLKYEQVQADLRM